MRCDVHIKKGGADVGSQVQTHDTMLLANLMMDLEQAKLGNTEQWLPCSREAGMCDWKKPIRALRESG